MRWTFAEESHCKGFSLFSWRIHFGFAHLYSFLEQGCTGSTINQEAGPVGPSEQGKLACSALYEN